MKRVVERHRIAPTRVMDVLMRVEESLEHPWTIARMASLAGLSASRFAHLFRETVGESPAQYLSRLSLERAAIHLAHSDWSIAEIALAAGYGSHTGFVHAFTSRFGVPPFAYRKGSQESRFRGGWMRPLRKEKAREPDGAPNRRFEAGGFERISERFRRDAERPKDASGAPSDSCAIVRRAARQIGEMSR